MILEHSQLYVLFNISKEYFCKLLSYQNKELSRGQKPYGFEIYGQNPVTGNNLAVKLEIKYYLHTSIPRQVFYTTKRIVEYSQYASA